jgi:alpha-galactosidase
LCEHLEAYGAHLAQNFGAGVQACYRGPRLYDTDETKAVVKKWVDFYKRHRPILDSDIIHVRRPDGRDVDCILHVNPQLKTKGLAMIYNPLDQPVTREVKLPLYYTGLTTTARIRGQDGKSKRYRLDRLYNVIVPVTVAARSHTWLLIE